MLDQNTGPMESVSSCYEPTRVQEVIDLIYTNIVFGQQKIEVSSFQGVLIRGVPAVLFIEVSSFQGVLIRGVTATTVLVSEVQRIHIYL